MFCRLIKYALDMVGLYKSMYCSMHQSMPFSEKKDLYKVYYNKQDYISK
jgi:hypothetical protein